MIMEQSNRQEYGKHVNLFENLKQEIFQFVSENVLDVLLKVDRSKFEALEEIRLRSNQPLIIQNSKREWFVSYDGNMSAKRENAFIVKQEDIFKSLELMCESSVYAFMEEIKNGYITLKGGHRVGIAGRTIVENSNIKFIKDISGLNIRISRQIFGCAEKLMKYIYSGSDQIYNTLIISPPACGKTTMLRDIARILGNGSENRGFPGLKVGIVDERSEIAACLKGVPQNDVGCRTDVLDGCPKNLGMAMLLRSMSPQVIITDEIGGQGDFDAVMKVRNAGVKIITSAHGYNISELKSRQEVLNMIKSRVFERYIVLDNKNGPGTVREIIDGNDMEVIHCDLT